VYRQRRKREEHAWKEGEGEGVKLRLKKERRVKTPENVSGDKLTKGKRKDKRQSQENAHQG